MATKKLTLWYNLVLTGLIHLVVTAELHKRRIQAMAESCSVEQMFQMKRGHTPRRIGLSSQQPLFSLDTFVVLKTQ